ncbi:hypothetical protein M0802_004029 [Mischocyttarus mexicanus]|nr:hypothetical protein M0802_004029 [Mischocyttarus mexicanus]
MLVNGDCATTDQQKWILRLVLKFIDSYSELDNVCPMVGDNSINSTTLCGIVSMLQFLTRAYPNRNSDIRDVGLRIEPNFD